MKDKPVRTRIAPSPTGDPHVGTIYIALFNLAFAMKNNGQFILRIEDTDQTRSHPVFEKNIYEALKWANIKWAEGPDVGGPFGPYRQSERFKIYQEHVKLLLDNKMAYKCFATKEELSEMREIAAKTGQKSGYDRRYRNLSEQEIKEREDKGQSYVIRLKVPLSGDCVFEDKIKGTITYPWADIDDQVLLKSDGFPTYHLANVVDDHLMQITHVIRGDEWLSSTPKHILLYEAFCWEKPTFMHMPLLLGKDGRKLSKRRNPTSTFYYRDSGFLPEALTNFLTLMGYSMTEDREIYSFNDFVKEFDINRIGKSGAIFDIKKLEWINQQYIINTLNEATLLERIKSWQYNDTFFKKLLPLCHTRMKTFADFMEICDFIFINNIKYSKEELCPKELTPEQTTFILQAMIWALDSFEEWNAESLEKASHEVAEQFGINHKKVLMPILFASVMGKLFGPPFFASAQILGKDRVRVRFLNAIEFLGGISNKKMESLKKSWDGKKINFPL